MLDPISVNKSHQNYLSRHHVIISYPSRLPNRKIKTEIPIIVGIAHPVSCNFKTHFPNIPSKKVANHVSQKRPAEPQHHFSWIHRYSLPMFRQISDSSIKLGMYIKISNSFRALIFTSELSWGSCLVPIFLKNTKKLRFFEVLIVLLNLIRYFIDI